MNLKLTNITKSTPIKTTTPEHARRAFLGALRVYGTDSPHTVIKYERWRRRDPSIGEYKADDWQEKYEQLRQRGRA